MIFSSPVVKKSLKVDEEVLLDPLIWRLRKLNHIHITGDVDLKPWSLIEKWSWPQNFDSMRNPQPPGNWFQPPGDCPACCLPCARSVFLSNRQGGINPAIWGVEISMRESFSTKKKACWICWEKMEYSFTHSSRRIHGPCSNGCLKNLGTTKLNHQVGGTKDIPTIPSLDQTTTILKTRFKIPLLKEPLQRLLHDKSSCCCELHQPWQMEKWWSSLKSRRQLYEFGQKKTHTHTHKKKKGQWPWELWLSDYHILTVRIPI